MDIPVIAAAQHGCFTLAQATQAGWSKPALAKAVRHGLVVRVRSGVYAEAVTHAAHEGHEAHLALIMAEQLALGAHWHAARRSAAVVWGLPLIGAPPDTPQLLRDPAGKRTTAKSRHRRVGRLPESDRAEVGGLAVTSLARTTVDIARNESFRNAVVVADAALRLGASREQLQRCLDEARAWVGVVAARDVASFADARAESPLESISRVAFHELGLPAPELQVEVWLGDRLLGRVDNLWRSANTIGEADGVAKFGASDEERRLSFRAAKQRQEWLEDVGFQVARWGWSDAWRPKGVLDARLLRAFERGRRQHLDPNVRLVPTGVELCPAQAA